MLYSTALAASHPIGAVVYLFLLCIAAMLGLSLFVAVVSNQIRAWAEGKGRYDGVLIQQCQVVVAAGRGREKHPPSAFWCSDEEKTQTGGSETWDAYLTGGVMMCIFK